MDNLLVTQTLIGAFLRDPHRDPKSLRAIDELQQMQREIERKQERGEPVGAPIRARAINRPGVTVQLKPARLKADRGRIIVPGVS